MKRLLTLTVLFLLQAGVTDSAARENRGDAGYRDLQRAEDGEMLTLDEAIRIGLENNYGIQIFRNTAEIASNNRTLGNAGFLPSVAGTGSRSEQVENSRFETDISGGETQGARSANTSAGIALDWTLFDGMQMFINHERLGEQERLGMDELRFRLETTLEQIISAYVNIIRINEQLNVLSNSVDVTRQRIEIAETKLDLGSGSEYELLQARTDLNADRAAVLRERNRLVEAKIILNELIALQPDQDYEVASDIELNRNLTYNELHSRMASGNASLQLARTEHRIARLDVREIRSERFPEIELNSGYSFNRTDGGGGFLRYNEAAGFNIGITARINLFDGFNTSRRIQNAKINLKNRDLLFEEEKQRVDANFLSAFRTYENSLELVELEENNMEFAEETLDIALERFRLGTISALEFREAQRAYLSAESRLIEAKYDAKVAETELLRLTGDLRHIAM